MRQEISMALEIYWITYFLWSLTMTHVCIGLNILRLHVISVRFYIQNNVCLFGWLFGLFDLGRQPARRANFRKSWVSYHKLERKKTQVATLKIISVVKTGIF